MAINEQKRRQAGWLLLFLLLPLLTGLACQTAVNLLPATPTERPRATVAAALPPTKTPHPTATLRPTSPPLATATASPAPTTTPVSTPDPGLVEAQKAVFDDLWNVVNDRYLYEDFNGVDWGRAYSTVNKEIAAGLTNEQFWQRLTDLIDSLADDHSSFLNPEEVAEEDAISAGNPNYVGIGVVVFTDDPEADLIGYVFPGGPADRAGIRPHDWLLAADGVPICCDEDGNRRDIVRGPEGTPVTLTIRTPGTAPREVTVVREPITGGYQVDGRLLPNNIAYIAIPTLWDFNMADQTRTVWEALSAAGPPDGLIIDLRMNGGGYSTELEGILRLFTDGEMGEFVSRTERRELRVNGRDINGSQDVPLVILIGQFTESYAEVLSGSLQENDNAFLIGQPTAGNVETLYGYDFADGSRAWIAEETFIPPSGVAWEANGVQPDMLIAQDWGDFSGEKDDLALQAALEFFR